MPEIKMQQAVKRKRKPENFIKTFHFNYLYLYFAIYIRFNLELYCNS